MFKQLSKKINKDLNKAGKSIESGFKKAGKDIDNAAKVVDSEIKMKVTRPIRNSALVKSTSRATSRRMRKTRRAFWDFVHRDVEPTVQNAVEKSNEALRAQSKLFRESLAITENWSDSVLLNKIECDSMIENTSSGDSEEDEDDNVSVVLDDLKLAVRYCVTPVIFENLPKLTTLEDFEQVNKQEWHGSLLHMAARFGNKNLAEIVFVTWYRFHKDQLENDLEIFGNDNAIFKEFEKRRRFSKFVDTTNEQGWTALHIACSKGHLEITKWLIQNGASIHSVTPIGSTPLLLAVHHNHLDIVYHLLDLGADAVCENDFGESAMTEAEDKPSILEALNSIRAKQLCVICMGRDCETFLLPCHHSTYCFSCWAHILKYRDTSTAYSTCPICRQKIENIHRM